jgi:glycosyltransferase involved in cell wall biosynthesis
MSKKTTVSVTVCVVIPAYNEGAVIKTVIENAKKSFRTSPHKVSFVVVNDGSLDNTSQQAAKAGAIVIDHIINSGAGGATATGLAYAKKYGFDIAATMDADGQHDPEDLLKGINLLLNGGHDLLIGSRLIDSRGMSKVKVIGNKGLGFITYLLFGVNSTDSQSGLRLFSKQAIDSLRWDTNGYEFCSEMLWRAKQQGLDIGEFSIKAIYTEYSVKKGQSNWNAINIVRSLLRRRIVEMFE